MVSKSFRKKIKNRVVFDSTSEKIVWEAGLVFANVREFREALTKYAIQERFKLKNI